MFQEAHDAFSVASARSDAVASAATSSSSYPAPGAPGATLHAHGSGHFHHPIPTGFGTTNQFNDPMNAYTVDALLAKNRARQAQFDPHSGLKRNPLVESGGSWRQALAARKLPTQNGEDLGDAVARQASSDGPARRGLGRRRHICWPGCVSGVLLAGRAWRRVAEGAAVSAGGPGGFSEAGWRGAAGLQLPGCGGSVLDGGVRRGEHVALGCQDCFCFFFSLFGCQD